MVVSYVGLSTSCSLLKRGAFTVRTGTELFIRCNSLRRLQLIVGRHVVPSKRHYVRIKVNDGLLFIGSFSNVVLRSLVGNIRTIRRASARMHIHIRGNIM